jgi:hypothetical protein
MDSAKRFAQRPVRRGDLQTEQAPKPDKNLNGGHSDTAMFLMEPSAEPYPKCETGPTQIAAEGETLLDPSLIDYAEAAGYFFAMGSKIPSLRILEHLIETSDMLDPRRAAWKIPLYDEWFFQK